MYLKKVLLGQSEVSECVLYDELRYRVDVGLEYDGTCKVSSCPFFVSSLRRNLLASHFEQEITELSQWDIAQLVGIHAITGILTFSEYVV